MVSAYDIRCTNAEKSVLYFLCLQLNYCRVLFVVKKETNRVPLWYKSGAIFIPLYV